MEIQEVNYDKIEEKRVNLEVFEKLSLEEISNLTDKEKEDYFDRCLNNQTIDLETK